MPPCKGYKTNQELKDLTPQIVREWERKIPSSELYLVKRQISFCCPRTNTLVPEEICRNCPHNYGAASSREIYCRPNVEKVKSTRVRRRQKLPVKTERI